MSDLESLAEEIDRDSTVVALTGAGTSAPSGVPTFRGDGGVWERFEEGQFTYGRFRSDPGGFWRDRLELQRELFGDVSGPNVAHEALATMERDGIVDAICTQNTDGLHEAAARAVSERANAGAKRKDGTAEATILELHGNAKRVRCVDCGRRTDADPVFERVANDDVPPRCSCGGIYKPDVVLFGEQLPEAAIQRAQSLARESDVFLAIGSSLVVEPAASLPRLAASTGATVAIVTLESTPCDGLADVVCREDVTDALPRLNELTIDDSDRS